MRILENERNKKQPTVTRVWCHGTVLTIQSNHVRGIQTDPSQANQNNYISHLKQSRLGRCGEPPHQHPPLLESGSRTAGMYTLLSLLNENLLEARPPWQIR